MEVSNGWRQVTFVLDTSDPVELWLQRRRSLPFDGILIHAGGVVIADLLVYRAAFRIVCRSFLENVAKDKAIALGQFSVAAIGTLICRDWILLEPSAAGVLIEIPAGIGALVHQVGIKALELKNLTFWRTRRFRSGLC